MKTVVIRECSNIKLDSSYELNLDTFNPKD